MKLILYSIFVSAIFARPNSEEWGLQERTDKLLKPPLGSCDASGLSPYVIKSLGLDPSSNYGFDDDLTTAIMTACKNHNKDEADAYHKRNKTYVDLTQYTWKEYIDIFRKDAIAELPAFVKVADITGILSIKYMRATGEIGLWLSEEAIKELQWCQEYGYCRFGDQHFKSLGVLSSDDWEKTLEYVKNNRKFYAMIKETDGNTLRTFALDGRSNVLVHEILELSWHKSFQWYNNCMDEYTDKIEPVAVKYCPGFRKRP